MISIYSPLSFWLDRKREIPTLNFFSDLNPNFELGFFLSLDICKPLHEVLDVENQSLINSWHKTNNYIMKSLDFLETNYNEEYESDEITIDLDRELVWNIKDNIGEPPSHCYPIYLITVGTGENERIVYVGKTSSKVHRFAGGHRVALKLHNPKYMNLEKKIYFGCVVFLTDEDHLPLEWMHPLSKAIKILDSVESGLIYHFKPELNTMKMKKNYSTFYSQLHIQNFTKKTRFLHDTFI
ncbi:hypothetical protein [Cytobacillus oceanisediminis]|uniref:hypothetical protein n=1 Tax=Cytobacillus oceanisediminis TaxID=665099 RepID=UPI00207AB86C|nr:hypothetical protein [Cytobacillus oceanisediminis]USK45520.1 hypothetical protein LIT27_06640 [Cytobacillus oceanisediminis]